MPQLSSHDQYDCGIIIALREEYSEKATLTGFAGRFDVESAITREDRSYIPFSFTDPDGLLRRGIATILYGMGPALSADVTKDMIRLFDPSAMINLGIAGAISSHLKLGDVVVAEMSEDYELSGAVVDTPAGGYRMEQSGTAYRSYGPFYHNVQMFETAQPQQYADWQRFAQQSLSESVSSESYKFLRDNRLTAHELRIDGGGIACGDKVVKSKSFAAELRHKKRKLLAVDMESAGFLRACDERGERPRLVLKAISDFADERKEKLDQIQDNVIRAWAMSNAYDLLARLLRSTLHIVRLPNATMEPAWPGDNTSQLKTTITTEVRTRYLKGRYQQLQVKDKAALTLYATLFRPILSLPHFDSQLTVFENLEGLITGSNTLLPIRIEGEPGTGKTTLLNLLYLWLLNSHESDPSRPFPIYINFTYYYRPPNHKSNAEAANQLRAHMEPVRQLLSQHPEIPVVLLLDGINEYIKVHEPLENEFLELMELSHPHVKMIAGIGLNYMANEDRFRRDLPTFTNAEHSLVLSGIPAASPEAADFLATLQEIISGSRSPIVRKAILECAIDKLKLTHLDLITAAMLIRFVPKWKVHSLAALYGHVCEEFINKHDSRPGKDFTIRDAASLAYAYAIRQELTEHDELLSKRHWRLIHRHRLVKDYLVAVHVVECFKELGLGKETTLDDLGCVYPQDINQFAKDIFNSGLDILAGVFRGIERALESGNLAAKTHACYMAGRVSARNVAYRNKAITILESQRAHFERRDQQSLDRHELLLVRTIHISLAYLGKKDASDRYLDRLMTDERWDDLNRGFHIEYYGDIPFNAQDPESMAHEDPMGNVTEILPCNQTLSRLYRRIMARLDDSQYGLRDIEVFTLYSLAQHRHALGCLDEDHRTNLRELVPRLLETDVSSRLRPYLAMMAEHLTQVVFDRSNILGGVYQLKREERRGWIGNVHNVRLESVADHSLFAVYLAAFYLPEHLTAEPEYNKQRIIDMLLFHDIGEFRTGDIVSANKTPLQDDAEDSAVRYLAACGTYLEVGNMQRIYDLYHEFENSDNINARIARDIDALEFYSQLNQYRLKAEPNFVREKERQVDRKIGTPIGRQIFDLLRAPYRAKRTQTVPT